MIVRVSGCWSVEQKDKKQKSFSNGRKRLDEESQTDVKLSKYRSVEERAWD